MKSRLVILLLLSATFSGCSNLKPKATKESGFSYTHAETTGNSDYIKSQNGQSYEIEFSADSDPEALAALRQLDTTELSSKNGKDGAKIILYGSVTPESHMSRHNEPANYFRLMAWRIEMPCEFYDATIEISLKDQAKGKQHPGSRLIFSLDQAPRTYRFKGETKSYKNFESKQVALSPNDPAQQDYK